MKVIQNYFLILCIFFASVLFGLSPPNISSEKDLILALLAAESKEKQDLLLETHAGLLTEELAKALFAEGEHLRGLGEYKKALDAYDLQYRTAERINYREGMARALDMAGFVLFLQDKYSEAREYLNRSLSIAEALNNKALIANVYSNTALIFHGESDFEKSLDYAQKGLQLREAVGDPIYIAISRSNIR